MPCVLGGAGEQMDGRPAMFCVAPSRARRGGSSGGGDELAGSQRRVGAGSPAGTGAGGAGMGRARLPSAPRLQAAPFWASRGQMPARSHRAWGRLRPFPKDNTWGRFSCHLTLLGGGRGTSWVPREAKPGAAVSFGLADAPCLPHPCRQPWQRHTRHGNSAKREVCGSAMLATGRRVRPWRVRGL